MNAKQLHLLARLTLPALVLSGVVVCSPPAEAGEVEAAEHRRLNQEMKKRAGQNAWAGVERAFLELVELQEKGEVITFEEWYLGAQAARGLGDIASSRERLQAALAIEENEEARNWLSDIEANYGEVSIKGVKKKDATHELTIKGMPFAPDQRAAVEAAQQTVATSGDFDGLLPKGSYTLASGECAKAFAVEPGGAVDVKCGGKEPDAVQPGLAFVGPRIDIGGGVALATGAIEGSYGAAGQWSPPEGFTGFGPRALVGVEAGLGMGLTFGAQVGYQSLFSGSGQLHAPLGQANVGYRLDKLWFSGSGMFAFVPSASVSGSIDEDQFLRMCAAEGTAEDVCAQVAANPDNLANVEWTGSGYMPGLAVTVNYALPVDIGGLKLAATVSGGSMFSPYRNYPWGSVGVTLAPQPK